jgi:hypothetical protein
MGLIAMSERYLQRIEVLSKVTDGGTTLVSAPYVLGLSTRQVRRLLGRIRTSLDVNQFLRTHSVFYSCPYRSFRSSSQAGLRKPFTAPEPLQAPAPLM